MKTTFNRQPQPSNSEIPFIYQPVVHRDFLKEFSQSAPAQLFVYFNQSNLNQTDLQQISDNCFANSWLKHPSYLTVMTKTFNPIVNLLIPTANHPELSEPLIINAPDPSFNFINKINQFIAPELFIKALTNWWQIITIIKNHFMINTKIKVVLKNNHSCFITSHFHINLFWNDLLNHRISTIVNYLIKQINYQNFRINFIDLTNDNLEIKPIIDRINSIRLDTNTIFDQDELIYDPHRNQIIWKKITNHWFGDHFSKTNVQTIKKIKLHHDRISGLIY